MCKLLKGGMGGRDGGGTDELGVEGGGGPVARMAGGVRQSIQTRGRLGVGASSTAGAVQ